MTIVNNCLLCFKEIEEEDTPCHSPKLLDLCLKYLHSSFAQDLLSQSSNNPFSFCSKCFRSAEELVEINEQMECFQKRISELVFVFSLEILHRRGQSTVFSDKVSNAKFGKNLIEFDISLLPNGDYWNNSSTSENNLRQTKNSHISENVYEEEISEPLLIPMTPANKNPIVDIVIEEIKFEDVQQNFVDDNVGTEEDYFNCENAVLSQSVGEDKELHRFSTGKVNNDLLPILKLQRLQFYDNERKVTALESGSNNSIGDGGIGKMKFQTVWTRRELGDSYRCIKKFPHPQNRSEDLGSSKSFLISNKTNNSLPVYSTDGEIPTVEEMVDTSVSKTKSSSGFDNPNCQLNPSTAQLPCTVVNKVLKTEQTVLENTRIHTVEPPFKCDICDKEFTSRSFLLLHTKCHSEVKRPNYDEPDSVSNYRQSLKVRKRVYNLKSSKVYSCEVCKRRFNNKQLLLKHERIHTGEKPYKCDVCDRKFSQRSNMLTHKKVHTGEKPYKCDVCDRRFAHQCNMLTHKKLHTGEKPFKCEFCYKRFAHRQVMVTHKMLHTGEKPFKCDSCDYASNVRSALKTHKIVKHSDSSNFKCRECKKDFKTATLVRRHYKGVHFALDFSDECVLKCS